MSRFKLNPVLIALALAVLLFVLGGILQPGFASYGQAMNILRLAAFLGIVAAGQTLVIISGGEGIDLSVGAVITLGAILVFRIGEGQNDLALLGLAAALAVGSLIGALNGVGITLLRIPPLVMTLGMAGVVQGLILVITQGRIEGAAAPALTGLVSGSLFIGIPGVVLVWLVLGAAMWLLLWRTAYGRRLFAVGVNRTTAKLSGVRVPSVVVLTYSLSGMLAALGGVVLLGYTQQVFLNLGNPYTLPSVAAVVVGGTLLAGGVGSYSGTMAGALVLTLITGLLTALQLPESARQIVYGVTLLLLLSSTVGRRRSDNEGGVVQEQTDGPLRIGFLGSGFIAGFHLQALLGVRDAQVAGVFSPTQKNREALAKKANEMDLGPCEAYGSIEEMLGSGEVDAVWILGPNDTRLDQMRAIHEEVKNGAALLGVACEKPLGRNLAEAREMLRLAEDAGLNHGYLENQVFSTAVQRGKEVIWRRGVPAAGRPYLARASEEHSGPHSPWFWDGQKQGGGVLSDMMCHSVEVGRFLLTDPGKERGSLKLLNVNATVASLKWTRPRYAEQLKRDMGPEVDYTQRPAEDFARGTLVLEDEAGEQVMIETTTSWSYVGPGLRIQLELLGPEYAMEFSTLNTGLKVFLSRNVTGGEGEDLVEKQSAEQGLMPVLEDEAATYGYTLEDRHMVECFRKGERPTETFHDGVAVVEMLMALYRSAETGRTVELPNEDLETYIPPVARGEYRG